MAGAAGVVARDVIDVLAGCERAVVARRAGSAHLRMVHAGRRRPGGHDVASLANIAGLQVRGVLAACSRAVVTADAVRRRAGVVELGRHPRIGRVAVVALRRGQDVVGILAGGGRAVVARRAATEHVAVVHPGHGLPGRGRVAGGTVGRRPDVPRSDAGGLDAVVAARATLGHDRVIEVRRPPGRGGVTGVARVGARDVRRRATGCPPAVVAGHAGPGDLPMIDVLHGGPAAVHVTRLAAIRGRQVPRSSTSGAASVVAGDAARCEAGVVELGRTPRLRTVAGTAVHDGLDVARWLARRLGTVVAARAVALHRVVVDARRGRPCGRRVTGVAPRAAHDVACRPGRRADARSRRVAGEAVPRRPLEDRVRMARLAVLQPVRAGEFVTRRQVIELPPGALRVRNAARERAQDEDEAEGDSAHVRAAYRMRAPLNVTEPWQRWHCRPN